MSNNCLSVLYKHIIQVENKYVGLKVGGTNIPLPPHPPPTPQSKKWGARDHIFLNIFSDIVTIGAHLGHVY